MHWRMLSFLCFVRRLRLVKTILWGLVAFTIACICLSFPYSSLHSVTNSICNLEPCPLEHNVNLYPLEPPPEWSLTHYFLTFSQFYKTNTNVNTKLSSAVNKSSLSVAFITVSNEHKHIRNVLEYLFIPYKIVHLVKTNSWNNSQIFSHLEQDLSVRLIIFENFATYTGLPLKQRASLDIYCRVNGIGVIGFFNDGQAFSTDPDSLSLVAEHPLYVHRLSTPPRGLYLARNASLLRVTRSGRMQPGVLNFKSSTTAAACCLATLIPKVGYEDYYIPIAFTQVGQSSREHQATDIRTRSCVLNDTGPQSENESHVFQSLVVEDIGRFDGVRRVLFATHSNGLWVNYMLFLDAIVHLLGPDVHASPPVTIPWDKTFQELPEHMELRHNAVPRDLLRWVLVDIDDVFLHGSGVAFTVEDAVSIVHAQNQWRRNVPDFKFNLGFCGQFFERADEPDSAGYNKLLELRHEFYWFDHLWNHHQAHQLNETELVSLMMRNKQFAKKHDIPVHSAYAVSPHHSGIYPVLESLYNAWRHVWNLTATSTEHYPRVHTLGPHLGFRFREVQVLPRQTCGVYSRFIQLADVPGGQQRIHELVFGGSLFHSILFNPVSIFMTHMTNYKGDRLALYLFDAVFRFVRQWTNLQLLSAPPAQLAHLYSSRFEFTGANDLPLYTDPCSDPRSHSMWPSGWPCGSDSLPQLVILGPQKTGSTALLHFLRLHPSLLANHYQFGTTFEELQFFSSDTLYSLGVRWYMDQFEHSLPNHRERVVRFEKSATYFTHHKAPARLHALLPQARLIVLLRNPIERALAWYQHSLAHRDPAAELLTFSELLHLGENVTANELIYLIRKTRINRPDINLDNITAVQNLVTGVRRLYYRCLDPGNYAPHLMRWLSHFPASQILPIDADRFAQTPAATLKVVQEFLRLPVLLNYSEYIEYNPHKGFFCLRSGHYFPDWPSSRLGKQSCLGSNKGRKYRHLDKVTEVPKLIRVHFAAANEQLWRLWHSQPVWRWWMAKAGAEYPSWVSAVGGR